MVRGKIRLGSVGKLPRLAQIVACLALLGSALAAVPASAAAGPYEPNDAAPAAAGPLLFGQSYLAALESSGDRDFYFFHVTSREAAQVSLTVQNLGGGDDTADIAATIFDDTATPVASQTFIRKGETRVMTATLEPQKYYLEVSAGTGFGDSYSIGTGGGAGAFGPFAQISSRCTSATAAARQDETQLNRLESKLQRTTARLRRSRYAGRRALNAARAAQRTTKSKVATKKRALRTARKATQPWCSISP
jgi:hypothetical protein